MRHSTSVMFLRKSRTFRLQSEERRVERRERECISTKRTAKDSRIPTLSPTLPQGGGRILAAQALVAARGAALDRAGAAVDVALQIGLLDVVGDGVSAPGRALPD